MIESKNSPVDLLSRLTDCGTVSFQAPQASYKHHPPAGRTPKHGTAEAACRWADRAAVGQCGWGVWDRGGKRAGPGRRAAAEPAGGGPGARAHSLTRTRKHGRTHATQRTTHTRAIGGCGPRRSMALTRPAGGLSPRSSPTVPAPTGPHTIPACSAPRHSPRPHSPVQPAPPLLAEPLCLPQKIAAANPPPPPLPPFLQYP